VDPDSAGRNAAAPPRAAAPVGARVPVRGSTRRARKRGRCRCSPGRFRRAPGNRRPATASHRLDRRGTRRAGAPPAIRHVERGNRRARASPRLSFSEKFPQRLQASERIGIEDAFGRLPPRLAVLPSERWKPPLANGVRERVAPRREVHRRGSWLDGRPDAHGAHAVGSGPAVVDEPNRCHEPGLRGSPTEVQIQPRAASGVRGPDVDRHGVRQPERMPAPQLGDVPGRRHHRLFDQRDIGAAAKAELLVVEAVADQVPRREQQRPGR